MATVFLEEKRSRKASKRQTYGERLPPLSMWHLIGPFVHRLMSDVAAERGRGLSTPWKQLSLPSSTMKN
ncbi:hypothetical protein EYF80_035416 [Liparis tanakae]|uniref:Uncharacterized protein n=1 Tax=Liparis tanakae TaxID=230148 RepID=A0A4Z2GLD1_9TELE|nr:hypothetical protein EYF80_035416 [Liparis tanakae]